MPKVFKMQQLGTVIQQILNAVGGKAEKSELNAHTGNGDVHVSTTDKSRWNDTYTKTQVDERIEQGGKVKTVSVNGGSAVQPDAHGNIDIEVPTDLKDLNDDATHRTVTDEEKSAWSGKQPAGDYATRTELAEGLNTKQGVGDYATNTALTEGLAGKQGTINDLETIRSGAGKGATSVQGVKMEGDDDPLTPGEDGVVTIPQPEIPDSVTSVITNNELVFQTPDGESVKGKVGITMGADGLLHLTLTDEEGNTYSSPIAGLRVVGNALQYSNDGEIWVTVQTFGNLAIKYVQASDPASGDEGDLALVGTTNAYVLKVYVGGSWVSVADFGTLNLTSDGITMAGGSKTLTQKMAEIDDAVFFQNTLEFNSEELTVERRRYNGKYVIDTATIESDKRCACLLTNNLPANAKSLSAVLESGKVGIQLWHTDKQNVTLEDLDKDEDNRLLDTSWITTSNNEPYVLQLDSYNGCNAICLTFKAPDASTAKGYISDIQIQYDGEVKEEVLNINERLVVVENDSDTTKRSVSDLTDYVKGGTYDIDKDDLVWMEGTGLQNGIYQSSVYSRCVCLLSNRVSDGCTIKATISDNSKVMYHFWKTDKKDAQITDLNKATDEYQETGWYKLTGNDAVPSGVNVIVVLFNALTLTDAKALISDIQLVYDDKFNAIYKKISRADTNSELFLQVLKKYRSLKVVNDSAAELTVIEDGDKITHDATLCVKNNKAYVVYCANKSDTYDSGEFSQNAVVRLDIYDISNGVANATVDAKMIVGKNGDTVGNKTISDTGATDHKGGAGVPNAYIVGSLLHIIFGAALNGTWTEIHCAYNITAAELSSLEQCTMDNSPLTGTILRNHVSSLASGFNYQLSFNASLTEIEISGQKYYYACICSKDKIANGIIVRTTDFVDWEFVTYPNLGATSEYEGAMGEYDGALYLALRQTSAKGAFIFAKFGVDGSLLGKTSIAGVNSRPSFYKQDGLLYVIIPSGTRSTATVYRVDGSPASLVPVAVIDGTNYSFGQYLEVVPSGDKQICIYTRAGNPGGGTGQRQSFIRLFETKCLTGDNVTGELMVEDLLSN